FLNGKMDLSQAEAVMDLISAKGKRANQIAFGMREGKSSKKIEEIKEELIEISAGLSVWADYPEEDIPQVDKNMLKNSIQKICEKLHAMIDNYDTFKSIKEGVKTAIVGRPNVGKSTLMNYLSDSQKSIVTDIPGTTRDAIEETVMVGDIPVLLIDTAGIRDTLDKVEKIGVEKAKKYIDESEITLFMIDASSPLCEDDRDLLKSLDVSKTVILLNKCDLGVRIDTQELSTFKDKIVELSALKGQGIDRLKEIIENIVGLSTFDPSDAVISNERQLMALKKAAEILEEIINQLSSGITLDAVTVLMQDALSVFMEFTGENVSEAVVNKVFSKFCVGK
ncbi:MAG: tRNA uridine-5-carboxymethylaminomethyl(34) synthesis GTPase MnmE, partial [Clostridia bacterium]|nr:tRNA uridine-5-carboxymethylaminomethyl(34) synthesis GTPase MnmE [Clostridia bacterium]